ncbi:hypothetical protein Hanom_Chr16g01479101 [Helianthus anomalus]
MGLGFCLLKTSITTDKNTIQEFHHTKAQPIQRLEIITCCLTTMQCGLDISKRSGSAFRSKLDGDTINTMPFICRCLEPLTFKHMA